MARKSEDRDVAAPPIYIVSGGAGASGEQVVESVLAQFPEAQVPIVKASHTRQKRQLKAIVAAAAKANATIVHTLVDPKLREYLVQSGRQEQMATIDLMGPLLDRLARVLGQKPKGQPGLYRQLRQGYFDRVEAIEFAIAHDDGKNPQDLPQADIVLTGVSRSGKTPLSMYLGVLGWKVANVPLVQACPVPAELLQVERGRVFALDIDDTRLVHHRRHRQRRQGSTGRSAYTDPQTVNDEVEAARALCRRYRFSTVSVTNKPIETSADEIIDAVTRRFGNRTS